MKDFSILLGLLCSQVFAQNWDEIKDSIIPIVAIPNEYEAPFKQSLATLGWEDGLHISPDGLNLYCTYAPIDLLSFVLNGDLPNDFSNSYFRGAENFGMDLISNPINAPEWLHSDILQSHRNSLSDEFISWSLSGLARKFYSEGAPSPTFSNDTNIEFILFTSNDNPTNHTDIWIIYNTDENPTGKGVPLPPIINTTYNEDNPQLTRIDSANLILFFDSDNLPGGLGDNDIWYSQSTDNGTSWTAPQNLSSINTPTKEHQPFIYKDQTTNEWYLYYSAYDIDNKLAIFRSKQTTPDQWNNWASPELVISAGNAAGIGEPTLTNTGDISFVVIYEDPESNSSYNHYDSDPWFLKRKQNITTQHPQNSEIQSSLKLNIIGRLLEFNMKNNGLFEISLFNVSGRILQSTNINSYDNNLSNKLDLSNLPTGIYTLAIRNQNYFSTHKIFLR